MSNSTFSDLLRALDPRPEVRFREFERICGWYLLNAPEYRSKVRRVWQWSEWPGAWGRDAGIDLVAEQHDGGLWAIQAKLSDPAYAIKKADVDSFLSESARYDFAYRLLIATTDRLGPTARKTLDSQRRPVGYRLRSQLELAPVTWPVSPADLRPRRPARKEPKPHVREAVRATVKGFKHTDRGQLLMACGTGKTLAGLWISERLACDRTLVLVPSLLLLEQTLREWSANAAKPFDHLAVCSDKTVIDKDEVMQHTSELGLPVTTDPDTIAAFLRRRGRRVVFATYQSSTQIAAAYQRGRTPMLDLAIADEAHRCAGREAGEFATILDSQRIRTRRRLFMTATPRYFTSRLRHEAGLLDVDIASMDDETAFGPVLHRLTFGEAIKRDLLSDYQVVVVGVDEETYRAWAERGELVTRDGETITDARTLAGQIGLAKAMRKYKLRRVISFHGRIKAAREFSADAPSVIEWMPAHARPTGALWSEHVSGTMTSDQRHRLLLRFRNLLPKERGLLSNARCLGEGVDVPSIDGIAFIDPRRSTTDIIQAVGRAIRKAPDKRVGTIILPVFLTDEDPEQALEDSAFKNVWEVLKALRAHDETLGEELDELRRNLGARLSPPRRPGKIKLDVPTASDLR
jgi:predicted helicase